MDERERLAAEIGDEDIIRYFYLDRPTPELPALLDRLEVKLNDKQDDVPFNAQVRGYFGATDGEGHPWIVKPIANAKELLYHRVCTLAFLLDHRMGTFAAPTCVFRIGGAPYRATKVVQKSVQISSYNYLDPPFIGLLRADLVNRWLFFDEDRNPNNYLVIQNKDKKAFLVAIDYDKADLMAEHMKITGMPEKFGWLRSEKTRFLTLLRPENFSGVSIEAFDARLKAMMCIPEAEILALCESLVEGYDPEPAAVAQRLVANILRRREYIDGYFRSMFKTASQTEDVCHDSDYSMFGESFLNQYRSKK
jgi:hypothetical protein